MLVIEKTRSAGGIRKRKKKAVFEGLVLVIRNLDKKTAEWSEFRIKNGQNGLDKNRETCNQASRCTTFRGPASFAIQLSP